MPTELSIRLAADSAAERRAAAALRALLAAHDLQPFLYTRDILIEEGGHPHSHPRLTLATRHSEEPDFLLAEFLHEQLHWFEEQQCGRRDSAIADSVRLYPGVPAEPPEGSGSEQSTRLHLLVCTWEYWALAALLGGSAARALIGAKAKDHYCWVYRQVLADEARLRAFIVAHGLVPPGLEQASAPAPLDDF